VILAGATLRDRYIPLFDSHDSLADFLSASERTLFEEEPRRNSVRMLTDGVVFMLEAHDLQSAMLSYPREALSLRNHILSAVHKSKLAATRARFTKALSRVIGSAKMARIDEAKMVLNSSTEMLNVARMATFGRGEEAESGSDDGAAEEYGVTVDAASDNCNAVLQAIVEESEEDCGPVIV